MRHKLRSHDGWLRCAACWGMWKTRKETAQARHPCFGVPVPHGHPDDRRHFTKLRWFRGANYVEALCDEESCPDCVRHRCDCDVCAGEIDLALVPGINAVVEDPVSGQRYALSVEQIARGMAR